MPSRAAQTRISADLTFSVTLPGRKTVQGTLSGSGSRLEVRLTDPAFFGGGRDAGRLRHLAAGLAERGITVVVVAGDVVLLELGATQAPWWQRAVTRSRHLRVVSVRGTLTGALGRIRGSAAEAVLPGAELLPPTTLLPLAPTFGRSTRPVGTTHDPRRGGNPRLVLTTGNPRLPADRRVLFPLRAEVTRIGSGADCDIRLDGLEPIHAVVVHDENDELVLLDRSTDHSTRVNGAPPGENGRILRTGARVTLGSWTLAYRRAEYADHGRPFGGRVGGELGHQRRQPDPRRSDQRREVLR